MTALKHLSIVTLGQKINTITFDKFRPWIEKLDDFLAQEVVKQKVRLQSVLNRLEDWQRQTDQRIMRLLVEMNFSGAIKLVKRRIKTKAQVA